MSQAIVNVYFNHTIQAFWNNENVCSFLPESTVVCAGTFGMAVFSGLSVVMAVPFLSESVKEKKWEV